MQLLTRSLWMCFTAVLLAHTAVVLAGDPAQNRPRAETAFNDTLREPTSRPSFEIQLAGLRARVAERAAAAERLQKLVNDTAQTVGGDEEIRGAGEMKLKLESLRKAGELEDPLSSRYYADLRERLLGNSRTAGGAPKKLSLVEPHPEVRQFHNFYTTAGRKRLRAGMKGLATYRDMMENIFRQEGLPLELIFVPMVESAYNPRALSKAGAKGLWQFIRTTGETYGLRRTAFFDEREDPEKSTRAAARYLKVLYERFRDWPLALASYNAGENRIERLLRRTGATTFWELARTGTLPQETRNYVPALFAVISLLSDKTHDTVPVPVRTLVEE